MIAERFSHLTKLVCSVCHKEFTAETLQTFSTCETCGKSPLMAEYQLPEISREDCIDREVRSMWRYFEMMPVADPRNIVSLGEGWTPILSLNRTAHQLDMQHLWMKDESLNPTGSFKARGMSAAVSKAKELGVQRCIVPSAGNAGVALAAYCAQANMKSVVVMPSITPKDFITECKLYGSEVILMDGLIDRCGAKVAEINRHQEYFDFSTMKEPYRLEGKRTMGYEIAEQFNWMLPDVILYPTGGGTGLIGMWKAFHEMLNMGWINGPLPRMIAVQSANCSPVVNMFYNKPAAEINSSLAYGLNVPKPFAMRQILEVLNESKGDALAISENEIIKNTKELIKQEGVFLSPEGGSLLAALKKLLKENKIQRDEKVLLLNTGSAAKYLSCLE